MRLLITAAILTLWVGLVQSHGYLKDPIARTSIQLREAEFNTQQPYWWDNQGVWCGNVKQSPNYETCGRCGDAPGETLANQNGIYDKKVIVATYTAGSIIEVKSEYQAPHGGQYSLELCPQETETDNCFVPLTILGGTDQVLNNTMCVTNEYEELTARVQLPQGVRCERCTVRWTYRTYYNSDPWDPAWEICWLNPAPTQIFRNCADVRII